MWIREPIGGCGGDDASGRAEADPAERSCERGQSFATAGRFGGEEFEAVKPKIEAAHYVARAGNSRQEWNASLDRRASERFGQTWRNDETGAGRAGLVQLAVIEDGPGSHDSPGNRRNRADRVERGRRSQRDFKHRQAAIDQRFRDRAGL